MGWDALLHHAATRHGVVALTDARRFGVPERTLRDRARRDGWTRLHPGVWLVAGARRTNAAAHVAAAAAVGGAFRETSALWVAGAIASSPSTPQLLLPHADRCRLDGIDLRRTRHLPDEDRSTVKGFATTTVARAVADLARVRSVPRLRSIAIDLVRDGHLSHEELAACHARLPRTTPGRGRVGAVLSELDGLHSDSDTEHEIRRDLLDLGYPIHPRPFPFRCDDGVVVHLDLALPTHWIYLEVDGFGPHSLRNVFESDRRKWTQVVRQWRPVWVTAERWRLARPAVLRDLDAAMALADPERAAARPA